MKATYLIDGKPHRECDCSANTATCPRGRERTCATAGFNKCFLPALDVLIAQTAPPEPDMGGSHMNADAYTVEQEDAGCSHCFSKRSYTIVGPDGVGIGRAWEDAMEVAVLADLLNEAFQQGQSSTRSDPAAWMVEHENGNYEIYRSEYDADAHAKSIDSEAIPLVRGRFKDEK